VSKQLTVSIVAPGSIVDAIAVADVQAICGAVAPDRILHKAWKGLGEGRIELAGVDAGGEPSENVSASAGPVAAHAIGMVSAEPP
jgi:hypothetical protein